MTSAEARHYELLIEGAGCASCVRKIEGALRQVPGTDQAEMNFPERSVVVTGSCSETALVQAVSAAGYRARPIHANSLREQLDARDAAEQQHYQSLLRRVALALALGLPLLLWGLAGGAMQVVGPVSRIAWWLIALATLFVMFRAGGQFYRGAWRSLRNRSATMDTLIALGTGAAWLYSVTVLLFPESFPAASRHLYFEACAMIIALVNLGQALEQRARGRASDALRKLTDRQVRSARVLRDGREREIDLERILHGDRIRLRPGEQVPVDGELLEGGASVDESMLTGEAIPVRKGPGDPLAAGTIVLDASLLMRASRVGEETLLAQIIETVRRAQASRPPIARLADRIAAWFVPAIVAIALASAALWLSFGPEAAFSRALVASVTVLIIACPCALGLATPMSVMVGIGRAARAGILIRDGRSLQRAADVTSVVLDKTGTVTAGEPSVMTLETRDGFSELRLLALAAALERHSQHPLGLAIQREAEQRDCQLPELTEVRETPGRGLSGQCEEGSLYLGSATYLEAQGISTAGLAESARRHEKDAATLVYLALNDRLAGCVVIGDRIRTGTAAAVQRLQDLGLQVHLLSGDASTTTAAVGRQLGIIDARGGLLPNDKAAEIRALQAAGEVVAMVGDGINDAPALAVADVGFAVGSATDVALHSAGVTLMRGDLTAVADAVLLSRATLRNIRQNLFGAFAYNAAAVPIAAGALYPLTGMLLSPVVGAAAMAMSSVTVVSNAARLRWVTLERPGDNSVAQSSPDQAAAGALPRRSPS